MRRKKADRTEDQSKSLLKPWVLISLILFPWPQSMCLEACTGNKAALLATAPETQHSPRDSKLLSSPGTSAGLPSEIPVPHHSRSPAGSPLLPQGFRRFFWVFASSAASAAASPVCKIRQASNWLVPADAKARDVTPSHPIRRLRRRGQRRTSRRNVFWMGEQLTSSLGQSEDGARVAGLGKSQGGCCSEAREGQSGLQRALPSSREIWSQPRAGPS